MSRSSAPISKSNDFLLRRLHSLSGLIPIGVFLVIHLTTNSLIAFSTPEADHYQDAVNRIHGLGPFLIPVEIVGIFLPIAFHAGLGVKIWWESKPNVRNYPYWCNVRYRLQRITGVIVLLFILVHLWHMHWLGDYVPGTDGSMFDPHRASETAAHAMQAHRWWVIPLYAIGIIASCYHFATGLWTFLITWGITVGERAQDRMGYVCAALGVVLAVVGLTAQVKFMTYPYAAPKQVERAAVVEDVGAASSAGAATVRER